MSKHNLYETKKLNQRQGECPEKRRRKRKKACVCVREGNEFKKTSNTIYIYIERGKTQYPNRYVLDVHECMNDTIQCHHNKQPR